MSPNEINHINGSTEIRKKKPFKGFKNEERKLI
jgi:hypothetical protein